MFLQHPLFTEAGCGAKATLGAVGVGWPQEYDQGGQSLWMDTGGLEHVGQRSSLGA